MYIEGDIPNVVTSTNGNCYGNGMFGDQFAWQKSATLQGDLYRIIAVLSGNAEMQIRTEERAKHGQGQRIDSEKI